MITLFIEGGVPMWFLLIFGLATMIFSARFAYAPVRRTLRTTFALGGATLLTIFTGICTDLATVGHQVPAYLKAHPEMPLSDIILQGIAESLSPGVMGFSMLSLSALIVALGFHREAAE